MVFCWMSIARDRGMDSGKEFENAGKEWFRLSPRYPGLEKKKKKT